MFMLQIEWSEAGDAVFHDICWKAVLDSVRMENPFSMCAMEKEVVMEAKKTAEYFDSTEKLDSEVERIVQLLRTASYAIAFTGQYNRQLCQLSKLFKTFVSVPYNCNSLISSYRIL